MNNDRLTSLFRKYVANTITKSELDELMQLIDQVDDQLWSELIDSSVNPEPADGLKPPFRKAVLFDEIEKQVDSDSLPETWRFNAKKWVAIAASILIAFAVGYSWYNRHLHENREEYVDLSDIQLPDGDRGVIKLEDGTTYPLHQTSEDVLRKEGIARMSTANGEVVYAIKPASDKTPKYQTFHSPKGTSSTLLLADGTKVYLNSGASITYPTHFTTGNRNVRIAGEAFFEVVHHPENPFIVHANGTEIQVLGTTFNVVTELTSEETRTTLVSGSVKVKTESGQALLTPGTQSMTTSASAHIQTYPVDVSEVIAWKEGYFRFNDDDVIAVLDKIKSWYAITDVEVQGLTTDRFTGAIKRTRKLSELLGQLEKISNYQFDIIEGRVIVMK